MLTINVWIYITENLKKKFFFNFKNILLDIINNVGHDRLEIGQGSISSLQEKNQWTNCIKRIRLGFLYTW